MLKPAIISFLFFFCTLMLQGQTAEMDRVVTLEYRNVQLSDVLADISNTYNIYFAYSNDYIPLEQRITLKVRKIPLSQALNELFEELPIEYTSIGNQIVLKRSQTIGQIIEIAPQPQNTGDLYGMGGSDLTNETFTASVEGVEILDPLELAKIPLMARPYEWSQQDQQVLHAPLLQPQFIEKEPFIKAQVSLVPSLGTNGYKSEEKTNNLSFNVISGRNGGVNGVEVGIMTNHVKNDVKGVQIAGLVNTVGGDVGESASNEKGKRTPGVQAAGLVNVADNVNAVQIGGLVNVTKGHFDGVQLAGLVNTVGEDIGNIDDENFTSGYRPGVQVAGLVNTGKNANAVQLAGLVNVSDGKFSGVQIAGIGNNVSKDAKGVQVAGIYNVNKGSGETQIATITNVADDIQGSQVSLFFNRAKRVKGVQVALVNVCDTTSAGSIGLINIVKRGYNRIELAGSLTLEAQAALKLGSYKFYNIFQGSRQFSSKAWSIGYGIGTAVITGKRTLLNLELIASHVNESDDGWTTDLNLLTQFRTAVEVRLGKHFSFFAGPNFSVMFSNLYDPDTGTYGSSVVPYTMYTNQKYGPNETDISMWIGFNAGMRF